MVRIDRIYTRSGDSGKTSLGDGSRVDKVSQRIITMGAVDEVNCQLGVASTFATGSECHELLTQLQQLLFDLGADLCCPLPDSTADDACPRISPHHVQWLETRIDEATEKLQPLNSFILPGGQPLAASLHLARAVCRRSELEFLRLLADNETGDLNHQVGVFLNRLSDLLFVLARLANDGGQSDVLWDPGRVISEES